MERGCGKDLVLEAGRRLSAAWWCTGRDWLGGGSVLTVSLTAGAGKMKGSVSWRTALTPSSPCSETPPPATTQQYTLPHPSLLCSQPTLPYSSIVKLLIIKSL